MAPKSKAGSSSVAGGYPAAKAGRDAAAGKAPAATAKKVASAPSKASRKQDKASAEAAREAALDQMLNPPTDGSADEEEEDGGCEDDGPRGKGTSARGPSAADKRAQAEADARMREELRRQREERMAERDRERAEKAEQRASIGGGGKKSDIAAVLEKVEKVGASKLSNKERRLYARHLELQQEETREQEAKAAVSQLAEQEQRLLKELEDFSVSLPSGEEPQSGAVDLRLDRFTISAGGQRLLDDAKLTLAKGRRYGLLGANGGGKTTLLKHLACRKLPVPEHWTVGFVEQEAEATETLVVEEVLMADVARKRLLAEETKLLERLEALESSSCDVEAGAEDVEVLCKRLVAIGEELEASGAEAAEARVRIILCGLGFSADMVEGPVSRLSGGWRMRVSLAKALFLQPDLLLLDEPTNHLDLDAVLWLDDYLSNYAKTLLVVSHDADFLDSVCTDVVHLEEQKLNQYRGGYTEFKRGHALHMREREKEFKKQQEEKSKGKKRNAEEVVQKPKDYIVKFRFLPPVTDSNDMGGISVHDVAFSYSGKKPWLLQDLNFRIDAATKVAVVGVNGAGKSTLLSLIGKVMEPCKGEVTHSRRLTVGRYSQHFDEISPALGLTAVEFLTSHELRRFGAGTESPELAHKCLGQFGLPSHAHNRPMKELSGGQKARVCFASITCRKPEILILDEPTNHLDIESVEALIDALKRFTGGLLLVSHDARLIQAAQCDLWVCKGPGEKLGKASSFEAYRKEVLADLLKRQALAEAEARKRMAARRKRRDETLQRRRSTSRPS